jgi:5-methylcytosine-specific restriction endonuclease McrA
MVTKCLNCGSSINISASHFNRGGGKYCSRSCFFTFRKPINAEKKKRCSKCKGIKDGGNVCWCKKCMKLYAKDWRKRNPTKNIEYCRNYWLNNKSQYKYKYRKSRPRYPCLICGKMLWKNAYGYCQLHYRGEHHHSWKGGISPINHVLRTSKDYYVWRTAIFTRDNFTCQGCGQRGGNLQVDHIKPFALYPELRFTMDNGRTMCVECHRKTDTWGAKALYLTP